MYKLLKILALFFLLAIVVVGYLIYSQEKRENKVTIRSDITSLDAKIVDREKVIKYANLWGIFDRGLSEYPMGGIGNISKISHLQIVITSLPQPYDRDINPETGKVIRSQNLVITNKNAELLIYLDADYWKDFTSEKLDSTLSAVVLTLMYEISHYPPIKSWSELEKELPKMYEDMLKIPPVFNFDFE